MVGLRFDPKNLHKFGFSESIFHLKCHPWILFPGFMKNEEQNVVNAVRRRFECQKKMSSGSQQNMNQILKYGYLTDKFSSACALAKK